MNYEATLVVNYRGERQQIPQSIQTEDSTQILNLAQELARQKCREYGQSFGNTTVTIAQIRTTGSNSPLNLEGKTDMFIFRLYDNHQAFITEHNSTRFNDEIRKYEEMPSTD